LDKQLEEKMRLKMEAEEEEGKKKRQT